MPIAKTHAYLISTKESDLREMMIRANSAKWLFIKCFNHCCRCFKAV